MFCVFFPIDIIFLDAKRKVVEIKRDLSPFTNYLPRKNAQYFIELESGIITKTKTRIGHEIVF